MTAERIIDLPELPRVLVGLYGSTGCGKSTLINALLDNLLLHSNTMRAGTSTVTEVAWNTETSPTRAYKAEIQFITADEWRAELDIICSDIRDLPPDESSNPETNIALAKINAVYPDLDTSDLKNISPAQLLTRTDLDGFLGENRLVFDSHVGKFKKALRSFTSSSSRAVSKGGVKFAVWPLIRLVKVFIKADVLKTGIVLVDLPGSSDDNAARNAVAQEYMKFLQHLWIASNIVRAVNDQVAKEIFGAAFKFQLMMDGIYNANFITFLMTKCDDITTDEAIKDLGLKKELKAKISLQKSLDSDLRKKGDQSRKTAAALAKTKAGLNKVAKVIKEVKGDIKSLCDDMEHPRDDIEPPKKRLRTGNETEQLNYVPISNQEPPFVIKRESETETSQTVAHKDRKEILQTRLEDKSFLQTELKKRQKELDAKEEELRRAIGQLTTKVIAVKGDLKTICIKRRTEWSTQELQKDFKAGIRELGVDLAESGDQVAAKHLSLMPQSTEPPSVYGVSAKAFHKQRGRLRKEPDIQGFPNPEYTGIPRLQKHCHDITLPARVTIADDVINELNIHLDQLQFWAEDMTPGHAISQPEKIKLEAIFAAARTQVNKVCQSSNLRNQGISC